jgi:hypothetical protein
MNAAHYRRRAAAWFALWVESGEICCLRACWHDENVARELEAAQ